MNKINIFIKKNVKMIRNEKNKMLTLENKKVKYKYKQMKNLMHKS
jgi:hypothetical protein